MKPDLANQTSEDRRLVTDAVYQASRALGLTNQELADVLGLSRRSVERMKGGRFQLDPAKKEWELALYIIRLFRSLDAICAGDEEVVRQWMRNPNDDLAYAPKARIRSIEGLISTLQYVDSSRAVA